MKKRKMVSALLAGTLALSMLGGCGSSSNESTKANDGTKANTESKDKNEGTQGNTEKDSSGETVTVKWCVPVDKPKDYDAVMADLNEKLKEKINVQLDLDCIPQGEYADRMRLMSTGQEDYDLCFTSNWLNSFDENMSRQGFLGMDDLLKEYGQGIVDSMPEWLMDVSAVDGKHYAVPNQQVIARQMGVVIQKEYADKYGFDLTSLKDASDLEPFLDQIVANEPTMYPIDLRVQPWMEKDYETVVSNSVYLKKDGDDFTPVGYVDAMEEYFRKANEWYKKGYIRQDIATVTDNSADVKANRYVVSMSSYKPGWDAEMTERQGVEWISVPIEGVYVGATSGIETMTAINVNSKNPEAAMKLLNLVYTDKEIFNELLFGLEDVNYKKTGETSAEVIGENYNLAPHAWRFGNQFLAWTLPGQNEDVWKETDKMNREAEVSRLRGFTFNSAPVQAELAQISAVVAEYKNREFTTDDVDGFISEVRQKMEDAGQQKVLDEFTKQVEEWQNTNK